MRHLCETCSTMRCSTQGRWRRQPETIGSRRITEDAAIRSMLPDYRIHLVSPAELSKADFGKFHTSLGDVLEFIKYSMDKDKLVEWLEGEKQDLMLGQKEVEVLNACVNADLRIQPEEEGVKMCKAIQDWKAEWQREMAPILKEQLRGEVTKQVTEQVTKQVTEQVTKQVTEQITEQVTEQITEQVTKQITKQATENNQLFSLKNLMRNLQLTAEQAGAALGISKADMERLLQKL